MLEEIKMAIVQAGARRSDVTFCVFNGMIEVTVASNSDPLDIWLEIDRAVDEVNTTGLKQRVGPYSENPPSPMLFSNETLWKTWRDNANTRDAKLFEFVESWARLMQDNRTAEANELFMRVNQMYHEGGRFGNWAIVGMVYVLKRCWRMGNELQAPKLLSTT